MSTINQHGRNNDEDDDEVELENDTEDSGDEDSEAESENENDVVDKQDRSDEDEDDTKTTVNDINGQQRTNIAPATELKGGAEKDEEQFEKEEEEQLSFAQLGLSENLVKVCVEQLQWKHPTPIQQQVIPHAIVPHQKDIIALAQTGSGKTGAFLLSILQNLLASPPSKGKKNGSKVLILTPTRELAVQIYQVSQALGTCIGATSCCIVGGVDRVAQAIALMKYPHFIIATPGRFVDHLQDTKGFTIQHSLEYLVLDEADRMLSMDFEQEIHTILDVIPNDRQTMLFSATMTSQVQKLQRVSLNTKNVQRIEVSTKFQTPKTLLQYYLFIPAKYKDIYLTYIMNEYVGQSIIVFGATCNNVQRIALMLRNLNFSAIALHGQMSQSARLGALQKFVSGSRTIMICTDVASRGLDLPNVDIVINYDLPNHGKEYIHRVGRTARAGKSGKAISIVTQYDVEIYQRIELLLGYKLPSYVDTHSGMKEEMVLLFAERVNEAQRLATRELKEQQSSMGKGGGGHHGRMKRRLKTNNDEYDHDTVTNDSMHQVQKQVQQKYLKTSTGGSGNKGGALRNQRGSSQQTKKYKHHRK